MDAAYVYKEVRDALSYFPYETPVYNLYASKLRTLLDKCSAEIASSALSGETKDRFKAALGFAKHCQKTMTTRPTLAGAWIDEHGRQGICDSYLLVLYNTPYDGLPKADVPERSTQTLRVDQIMPKDYNASGILPDVQTLKAKVKVARLEYDGPIKRFHHYTILDFGGSSKIWLDTEMLITAIECIGSHNFQYCTENTSETIRLVGKDCSALLVPLHVKDGLDENNTVSFTFRI